MNKSSCLPSENYEYTGARPLCLWGDFYKSYHGYISIVICFSGVIVNIINIAVLTRKDMRQCANVVLTYLAVSDLCLMAVYIPFCIMHYILPGLILDYDPNAKKINAQFMMFFANFSVFVHGVAVWLTVALAAFRYVYVTAPSRAVTLCSVKKAHLAAVAMTIWSVVANIPSFASYEIIRVSNDNETQWFVAPRYYGDPQSIYRTTFDFNSWIQALVLKLIPCILVAVLIILIVQNMLWVERKRSVIKTVSNGMLEEKKRYLRDKRAKSSKRTTVMLVLIVLIFVLTETPHGILQILNGTLGKRFFKEVYSPLGDLLDIMALFNSAINFVLYCSMSEKYRKHITLWAKPVMSCIAKVESNIQTSSRDSDERHELVTRTNLLSPVKKLRQAGAIVACSYLRRGSRVLCESSQPNDTLLTNSRLRKSTDSSMFQAQLNAHVHLCANSSHDDDII